MTVPAKDLDVRDAARLAEKFSLRAVQVVGVKAQPVSGASERGELGWKLRLVEVAWGYVDGDLRVVVPVTLAVLRGSEKNAKRAADIGVLLRLDYEAKGPIDDEKSIASFVGISGCMHAWPYIRAEIQLLSTKIGLPPLLLPPIVSGHVERIVATVTHVGEESPKRVAARSVGVTRKAKATKLKRKRKQAHVG